MPTNRAASFAAALLLATGVHAGEVYKCKGADGKITFTNIKCPEHSSVKHYGTFAPVDDDPRQVEAAAAEADRIRYANEQRRAIAQENLRHINDQEARRDAALLRAKVAVSAQSAFAEQQAGQARFHSHDPRVAGADIPESGAPSNVGHQAAIADPPRTVSCQQSSGNVTCLNTDGSMSRGVVDPLGNGSISNDAGGQQLTRDAFGHMKTQDGTCVKDIYGQCQ